MDWQENAGSIETIHEQKSLLQLCRNQLDPCNFIAKFLVNPQWMNEKQSPKIWILGWVKAF